MGAEKLRRTRKLARLEGREGRVEFRLFADGQRRTGAGRRRGLRRGQVFGRIDAAEGGRIAEGPDVAALLQLAEPEFEIADPVRCRPG